MLSFMLATASLLSLNHAPAAHLRRSNPPQASQATDETGKSSLPLLLQPTVSIGAGSALLLALVGNRLLTDDLFNSQSRSDLIATLAPILLVLKALSDFDITPREAEAVPLDGTEQEWVSDDLRADARAELEWAADSLFASTPCCSLAIWQGGQTQLLRGLVPRAALGQPGSAVSAGPLLSKCVGKKSGAPEYLPSLQLLPGRMEFTYLPEATQSVLILPLAAGDRATPLPH